MKDVISRPQARCCEKGRGILWIHADEAPFEATWCTVSGQDKHEGTLEYAPIQFCPYCGTKLPDASTANGLAGILRQYRIRFDTERKMQEDIRDILKACDIKFVRERKFPGGPIDFLTDAGVGIECKVDGAPSAVLRQLLRYVEEGQSSLKEMLLVTSKGQHRWRDSLRLLDSPFIVLWVGASSL